MFEIQNYKEPRSFKLFIWLLMSFQAGYINVGGFLIFGNFVSHVTGTSSQVGMGVGSGNTEQIITFISLLLSFILGAAISGHFIGKNKILGKKPRYTLVTGLKVIIFTIVLLLSEYFFLVEKSYTAELTMIILLSLVCGIQNATCSQATKGFLKPTHMTGLSTDIGINLTRRFGHKTSSQTFRYETYKNNLRIKVLSSFIGGGIIAYMIFSTNGHYGFIFPLLSSICLFLTVVLLENQKVIFRELNLKIIKASIISIFTITILFGLTNSNFI